MERAGKEGTGIKEGKGGDGGRFVAREWKREGRNGNKGRGERGWGPLGGKGVERGGKGRDGNKGRGGRG